MEVRLVLEKGGRKKKVLTLKSAETVVGRRQDCDLRIPSEEVSRRHALLSVHDGRVMVEDLDSVNGVFINHQRITGKQLLMPGDRLEIGPVTFIVEYEMTQGVLEEVRQTRGGGGRAKAKPAAELEDLEVLPLAEEEDGLDVLPVLEEEAPSSGVFEGLEDLQVVDDEPVTMKEPLVKNPLSKLSPKQPAKPQPAPKPPEDDDAPIPLLDDADDLGNWALPQGGADMRSLLSGMDDGKGRTKREIDE